jgi:hypothetical protein
MILSNKDMEHIVGIFDDTIAVKQMVKTTEQAVRMSFHDDFGRKWEPGDSYYICSYIENDSYYKYCN